MKKLLLRRRSFCALQFALVFSAILPLRLSAQVAASTTASSENQAKSDTKAFTMLFRRVNRYREMAQAAKSPDEPVAHLTSVLPQRLKLSSSDAASLQRLAVEWATELAPLRLEVRIAIDQHHAARAEQGLNSLPNPSPPVALKALQDQMDAVTLRYRDLWQNTIPPAEFSRVQNEIRKMFGATGGSSSNLQSQPDGGAQ